MRLEHKLEPKLQQQLKVTPQMILINRILQLQRLELREEIEQVLKENPALELVEDKLCPRCGESLENEGSCRNCESSVEYTRQDPFEYRKRSFDDLVNSWDSGHFEDSTTYERTSTDDEFDPLTNTASESDFRQELKRNFLFTYSDLDEIEISTAQNLIELIDDRGLIEINDDELAESIGVLPEIVKMAREKIIRLDPVGIGARNTTQAMLAQLDTLHEQTGRDVSIEKTILSSEYRDLLARENYTYIAKLLNSTPERIKEASEYIRSQLYPFPGDFFNLNIDESKDPDFYPEPDVIIRNMNGEYYPEIQDSGLPHFRISNYYLEAYRKIKEGHGDEFTEDEKKHIKQYLEKAQFFLSCINQRRETITRICNFLIKYQMDFLQEGIRKLKDLTREKVAHEIGFHPSTISRALKDKYVQLPNGSIHPFDIFFDYQKVMILVIKEIIERDETIENMMTDDVIADKMKALGFNAARRTIAKYRERRKIPARNVRKRKILNRMGIVNRKGFSKMAD